MTRMAPGGIEWRVDVDSARLEARKAGRLLLVYFHLLDRPLCRTMEEEVLSKPEAAQAVGDRFVAVRADIDVHGALLESILGHRAGLATGVLDTDGDVVSARKGYVALPDFVKFLDRAAAGAPRIREARAAAAQGRTAGRVLALAEEYRACDSVRRAEQSYLEALEAAGSPIEAPVRGAAAACHDRLARIRIAQGRNLEARKHLEQARALDPEGRSARKDRLLLTEGLTLAVERRHAEAARVLKECVEGQADDEEADHAVYALGFVLHQSNRDAEALRVFEDGLKRFPRSTWAAAMKEQIGHIKNPQPDHTH